jgi:hypothetical protein
MVQFGDACILSTFLQQYCTNDPAQTQWYSRPGSSFGDIELFVNYWSLEVHWIAAERVLILVSVVPVFGVVGALQLQNIGCALHVGYCWTEFCMCWVVLGCGRWWWFISKSYNAVDLHNIPIRISLHMSWGGELALLLLDWSRISYCRWSFKENRWWKPVMAGIGCRFLQCCPLLDLRAYLQVSQIQQGRVR